MKSAWPIVTAFVVFFVPTVFPRGDENAEPVTAANPFPFSSSETDSFGDCAHQDSNAPEVSCAQPRNVDLLHVDSDTPSDSLQRTLVELDDGVGVKSDGVDPSSAELVLVDGLRRREKSNDDGIKITVEVDQKLPPPGGGEVPSAPTTPTDPGSASPEFAPVPIEIEAQSAQTVGNQDILEKDSSYSHGVPTQEPTSSSRADPRESVHQEKSLETDESRASSIGATSQSSVGTNVTPSNIGEASGPVIPTPGDIDTFNDWAKKKLEAVAKERESSIVAGSTTGSSTPPSTGTPNGKPTANAGAGPKLKAKKRNRKNYASSDCGAKVVASNPEAQSASAIISSGMDEYFLSPCKVKNLIYFVIELCEAVEPSRFEIGVYELYSSLPKEFVIGVSDRYPTRDWTLLGKFEAREERGTQNFTVENSPGVYGKYVKVEILNHYGAEHFCPISIFKLYGISELEAMEQMDVDAPVSLEHGSSAPLYALNEDEYIDDSDDDGEPDLPRPKNLFGSAKDAVMSIVKKAAEAFSAALDSVEDGVCFELGRSAHLLTIAREEPVESTSPARSELSNRDRNVSSERMNAYPPAASITFFGSKHLDFCPAVFSSPPKEGSKDSLSLPTAFQVIDDGQQGPLAGWAGKCACPSRRVPPGVSGEAWDAYSCSRPDSHLAQVSPKNWQPCFDSLRLDMDEVQEGCFCSPISRLFAAFLNKDQILAVAVTEAFNAAEVVQENATCVGTASNTTFPSETLESSEVPQQEPIPATSPPVEKKESEGNRLDTPVSAGTIAASVTSDMQTSTKASGEDEKKIAAKHPPKPRAVGDVKKQPKPPTISPTATVVETAASFTDPGEGLASSSEPTEPVVVFPGPTDPLPSPPTPPPRVIDMDDARLPTGDPEFKDQTQIEEAVVLVTGDNSQAPLSPDAHVPSAGSTIEGIGDLSKLEIGGNVPFVPVAASSSPPGNKETAFWRLSNKVKALELNLTLSSLYLEELSKSYKRQVEDLTKAVNKYQQQMMNYTTVVKSLSSQVESLNVALSESMKRIDAYESSVPVPMWLFVLSQTLLVVVISMVQWTCRREPRRVSGTARADPTVTPAVIRPARVRTRTGEASKPIPAYGWLDQNRPGIVCGKAVPVASVVSSAGGQQLINGTVGQLPGRAITVVTDASDRSRASSSGDEAGTRRLRLVSASEALDLSPLRLPPSQQQVISAIVPPSSSSCSISNGARGHHWELKENSLIFTVAQPSPAAVSVLPSPLKLVSPNLPISLSESTNFRPPVRASPAKYCALAGGACGQAGDDSRPLKEQSEQSMPPKGKPSSSDQISPSKLVRRHSFSCEEDASSNGNWSVAGSGKSKPKTVAVNVNGHLGKRKHKRKNRSSWDLRTSGSRGSSDQINCDPISLHRVGSKNRWIVLDSQDVRI